MCTCFTFVCFVRGEGHACHSVLVKVNGNKGIIPLHHVVLRFDTETQRQAWQQTSLPVECVPSLPLFPVFETGPYSVAQAGLKFTSVLLPQLPEVRDHL